MTRASRRRLILLGSTGSIGTSALDVLERLAAQGRDMFEVVGLAAGANATRLAEQATRWSVKNVAIANPVRPDALDGSVTAWTGPDAARSLVEAIAEPGDLILGAMVGAAGLPATIAAIDRGCDIALANKETLVAAGSLVIPRARARGVQLYPVDSEHSAVAQCMRAGHGRREVRRIVLTASGGPFRTWTVEQMAAATVDDALNHPTWTMGPKVTVDSASMTNKALEIIEAHWLFDVPAEQIEVVVHPQSVVHSFVEFVDGSTIAQLSPPDMRIPIQHALTWPERFETELPSVSWPDLRRLDFEPADTTRFPALEQGRQVIRRGGTAGAVFNGANEAAVEAFLAGMIRFPDIHTLVSRALETVPIAALGSLDDVLAADTAAREVVRRAATAKGRVSAGVR